MLEKNHKKLFDCTGIEIDEDIIYLANRYANYELKSGVQIIQASADLYVMMTEQKYEMICIDVFVQDKIPGDFLTKEFLESIVSILSPSGYVLFNHLSNTEEEKEFANSFYRNTFEKLFDVSRLLDVGGNYVLIGKIN
jgi:spermidine synthase